MMDKALALKIAMLLSALESWSFSSNHRLPDHLLENLNDAVGKLEQIILEEKP